MAEHAAEQRNASPIDSEAGVQGDVEPLTGTKRNPYLLQPIENYLTSIPILFCSFSSGVIDAAVFNAWGVFACIQTGNTIILAIGAADLPEGHDHAWLQGLIPVIFFFFGAFFLNRVGTPLGQFRRSTLSLQFFTQSILIILSAALITVGTLPNIQREGNEPFLTLIPLAMLAFQAGMQSCTARQLGLNEIPTTVLTSVYCDLGNDPRLFAPFKENWQRNRRVGSVIFIVIGGICGGWLSRTAIGMAAALWLAAGVKVVLSIVWLFWAEEKTGKGK